MTGAGKPPDDEIPDAEFQDTEFQDTEIQDTEFQDTEFQDTEIPDAEFQDTRVTTGEELDDEESDVAEPVGKDGLVAGDDLVGGAGGVEEDGAEEPGGAKPQAGIPVGPAAMEEGAQGLRRATTVMAVGTTLSRATGVLRVFALAYALGAFALADSYNLANTMPNIIHDVVLGGVLSATFVPVFVHRLSTRANHEAWDAISAVVSVTMIVIAVASILFVIAVPFVVDGITALNHTPQAAQSRTVAKDLLYLFAPQLTCYGFISVGTALLNSRRRFGAPMFAPIANNVVLIVLLIIFGTTVRHATLASVAEHRGQLLLLGLGTTAGVVAQAAFMVPSLRRAGLRLEWRPDFRHEAVRTILRLSGWTFGLVAANQVALVVVLAMSEKVGTGAVSAYTYAYTFFQLAYGIVAVSIMSAIAPELAARWATGDLVAFRRRMGTGLRAMLALIIPAAAGEVILARPLVDLVLGHGAAASFNATAYTAQALAVLSLGLPGFCVFLYAVRVLQSVQDLRSAFWLYAFENGVNIVLAVALSGHFGVRGIALSISAAYTLAAVVALAYVRTRVQGLGGRILGRPLGHVLLSTCALIVATVLGSNVSGSETTLALFGRVALGFVAGGVAYVLAAGGLAELAARKRRAVAAGGAPPPEEPGPPPSSRPPGIRMRRATAGPGGPHRRRPGAPPPPEPLHPAGRPPLRPTRLGPTRAPDPGGSPPGDAGM